MTPTTDIKLLLAGAILSISVAGAIFFLLVPPNFSNNQITAKTQESFVTTIKRLFPRTNEHDFASPVPGSYQLPVIKPAGDGDVLDIHGKPRRLKDFQAGKITILSFMYALCSDSKGCPLATATLIDARDASKQLPRIANNTRFISLSFNPQKDSPEAMESYGYSVLADPEREKKIPWEFLTTASTKQLKPILKSYGQVINPKANGENISHLLRLYLIDKKGQIRNIYGLGFLDPRNMFADIETLLLEESATHRSN